MDPGFIFAPADYELTDDYLGGEIAGRPVASTYINHADVYSALPEDLVSGRRSVRDRDGNDACYIISPVRFATKNKTGYKLRGIDGDPRKSYWHSEGGKIPVKGSETGGYVQDFTHAIKNTAGRTRTERLGWRMKEYGISTEHGDSDIVICKVYHTRRKPSTASTSTTPSAASSLEEDVPALYSDPAINSKKRKAAAAADGDYPEDSTPSARPRLTQEEHRTTTTDPEPESAEDELFKIHCQVVLDDESFFQNVEQEFPSLYPKHDNVAETTEEAVPPWAPAAQLEEDAGIAADHPMGAILGEEGTHPEEHPPTALTPEPENAYDELYKMYCQVTDFERIKAAMPNAPDPMEDLDGYLECFQEYTNNIAQAEAVQEIDAQPAMDVTAAPPSSMEQEFPSLYPDGHSTVALNEEAAPPWAPVTQMEEEDLAELLATMASDDQQMDSRLSEEGAHPEPEPDEPAPDEVVYGLPCPAFSPEMVLRCSDDVMTPWPSPSSMRMIYDLY